MYEAIKNFHEQFAFEPQIENASLLPQATKYVVVGMGGSHLAADLLRVWNPALNLIIHEDYGLPAMSDDELRERLIILSSYSGNTEEVLEAFEEARIKNLPCAVITIGGKLLELAKTNSVPYIQMPDTGIQPRCALGFSLMALFKLIDQPEALQEARQLSSLLRPDEFESSGQELAKKLQGFVPVIYSSRRNIPIAYNWKIKLNETGKIPAFYNFFPELNHNEMNGFDVEETTRTLSNNFAFLLLEDKSDQMKIQSRMQILKKLYQDRSFMVESIKLPQNNNRFYKIFSSIVLADWVAYYTAKYYDVEPEQVPMVEEFKKLIR